MSAGYLDFHTHQIQRPEVGIRIINHDLRSDALPADGLFSCGIHPWYAGEVTDQTWQRLEAFSRRENCILIGECGLDRVHGPDFSVQLPVLERQMHLAERLTKPMVIHCVRGFQELIAMKRKVKLTVPVIIHGFNKNIELAKQLEKEGFYLSVGSAVQNSASGAAKYAAMTEGIFFLETDDSAASVKDIYLAVAELRKIPVEKLKDLIFANWKKLKILEE